MDGQRDFWRDQRWISKLVFLAKLLLGGKFILVALLHNWENDYQILANSLAQLTRSLLPQPKHPTFAHSTVVIRS